MIINGSQLLQAHPIRNMLSYKAQFEGVSHGLSEAGYDICLKQTVLFERRLHKGHYMMCCRRISDAEPPRKRGRPSKNSSLWQPGRFVLGSSIEEFQMPGTLVGIVHDKSTWARQGLSVFNTVIEPGWKGFLTLELVYNGHTDLCIPAGTGIAQVLFHQVVEPKYYVGKYQHQADEPVSSKFE